MLCHHCCRCHLKFYEPLKYETLKCFRVFLLWWVPLKTAESRRWLFKSYVTRTVDPLVFTVSTFAMLMTKIPTKWNSTPKIDFYSKITTMNNVLSLFFNELLIVVRNSVYWIQYSKGQYLIAICIIKSFNSISNCLFRAEVIKEIMKACGIFFSGWIINPNSWK